MTTATTGPSHSADSLRWSDPDADVFRDAMRCMASTVSLVTAHDARGHHGMAASAVISVSADPPSMLVAVNHGASIHSVISLEAPYGLIGAVGSSSRTAPSAGAP